MLNRAPSPRPWCATRATRAPAQQLRTANGAEYTLSECAPIVCTTPSTAGYTQTENKVDLSTGAFEFDVVPACATGWEVVARQTRLDRLDCIMQ